VCPFQKGQWATVEATVHLSHAGAVQCAVCSAALVHVPVSGKPLAKALSAGPTVQQPASVVSHV
jgi:hypothetical protein